MSSGKSKTKPNIVLIGMPGAGKSTLGVLLAKSLAKSFVDTDLLLQAHLGMTLQMYLDQYGYLRLRGEEEKVLLASDIEDAIIATGGSVVYSERGMQHLKAQSSIVYLSIRYETLLQRVHNAGDRGLACPPGTSLKQLYEERENLYQLYADIIVKLDDQSLEQSLELLVKRLSQSKVLN